MGFGGFMAWQSTKLSIGVPAAPRQGFFPFCLGLILIGLGLIILVQGVTRKNGVKETTGSKSRVILTLATIFAYPFTLEPLGYLLSTFLFIFLLLKMMVKKAWWFAPVVACFVSVVSYILFKVLLKVLLPDGLLAF